MGLNSRLAPAGNGDGRAGRLPAPQTHPAMSPSGTGAPPAGESSPQVPRRTASPLSAPLPAPAQGAPGAVSRGMEDLYNRNALSEEDQVAFLARVRRAITDEAMERGVPQEDSDAMTGLAQEVFEREAKTIRSHALQRAQLLREVLSFAAGGYGPLTPLLDIPDIEDIMVNGYDEVWIAAGGGEKRRVEVRGFRGDDDVVSLVERLAAKAGRPFNFREPIVDTLLPDGNRLNAVRAGISLRGTAVTIRVHRRQDLRPSVADLEGQGMIPGRQVSLGLFGSAAPAEPYDPDMDCGRFLRLCVRNRVTTLFIGPTGTGKTTVMDAYLRLLPELVGPGVRVVTVEDVAELTDCVPNVVRLQTRRANSEGVGEVGMEALVAATLRMRPDIIVVGEVRALEGAAFIVAVNTGHAGSMTSIHADSPQAALPRLEGLLRSGTGFDGRLCRDYLCALQLLVQIGRDERTGRRAVREVASLDGLDDEGRYLVTPLYTWRDGRFLPTGRRPAWAHLLSQTLAGGQ